MALHVKWPQSDGSSPEVWDSRVGDDFSARAVYRVLAEHVAIGLRRRGEGLDEDEYRDDLPVPKLNKSLAKELKKLARVLLEQGAASHSFVSETGDTIRLELTLSGPASTRHDDLEDDADYDAADYIDQVVTVAVPAVTFIAGTVLQETLQRAAGDSYDGTRRFFASLRARLRRSRTTPPEPEAELSIVRSEDGQWALQLPGNLDHEAHAALIRDFDALVREHGDGERFTVEWRDGRWNKSADDG
ncbi:hypothetical protein [Streptomyces filamentosus]|uniref:hypothetical protein n=1 Tax=Streptomyces filamentosus TaxID=67294 RepID=UPI0033E0546C